MEDFRHDFVFLPRARRDYDALSSKAQEEVDTLIERICRNPEPDGDLIHDLSLPPITVRLADDWRWAILFNVVPSFVVQLLGIVRWPLRDVDPS